MWSTAVSADGLPVGFEVRGRGAPALVFVHGWSCDHRYRKSQLSHFAERHRVVVIDLAGHGESGSGRREWSMPAFGADVVAVADQLGLERTVLIGHSMGGDVVVAAALAMPTRVAGLVWVDTYRTLGTSRSRAKVDSFLAPFRADFEGATESMVRGMFLPSSDPTLVNWVAADMAAGDRRGVRRAHATLGPWLRT